MVERKQMHAILLGMCGLVFGTSCASRPAPFAKNGDEMRSDRPAPFKPAKTYPEWAYDAPSYTRPVDEPKAEPKSRVKDPDHYFTSKPVIMVHQPEGYRAEEIPRVAVWYTRDNGHHWKKAGYFGRSATYFPLQVKKEGDYGIRFVGPGQEAAMETPPGPVCVHHVDMTPPKVKLAIEPEQAWYTQGQRITVNWTATDPHLETLPARVSVVPDWESNQAKPIEIAREQADAGSMEYTVPSNLMGDGFRIRVDAIDRAGNVGLAYSQTLQIEPDRMESGARPPVQTIRHDAVGSNTTETHVNANAAPVSVDAKPVPIASMPASSTIGGGEMLPLEEIPVSGSVTPVKDTTPSPTIETTQAVPPTHMDTRAQAQPARTPSVMPKALSSESLSLLPLDETPASNGSISAVVPIEPARNKPDPRYDQTIVRDTPSEVSAPPAAGSDEPEFIEEDTLIRPVTVIEKRVENQPQASQQQDVECDSIEPESTPIEAIEETGETPVMEEPADDEASASGVSGWQTIGAADLADVAPQAREVAFGRTLVKGIRAAEAAVEKLLAGVRDSNGVTAAELVRGADVMVGGGLAAPMPATVLSMTRAPKTEPPHAWRTLATRASRRGGDVWTLPRPALRFELPRLFARETFGASPARVGLSAERGSRIEAVAVSSDLD